MRLVVVFLFSLCLGACVLGGARPPEAGKYVLPASSQRFAATSERALAAAKLALAKMKTTIDGSADASGVVRTTPKPVEVPQQCDCGTWNAGTFERSVLSGIGDSVLVLRIVQDEQGVSVNLEHSCTHMFVAPNGIGMKIHKKALQCASVGLIEADFWEKFQRALRDSTAGEK